MTSERRTATKLEQHVGTLIQAVIVALLVWTGTSMLSLREQMAVMRVEVKILQTTMEQRAVNRYTAPDAARDLSRIYIDMLRLEKRIEVVESAPKERRR